MKYIGGEVSKKLNDGRLSDVGCKAQSKICGKDRHLPLIAYERVLYIMHTSVSSKIYENVATRCGFR